ncbi:diacylglycerol/lipid kinase family protein [Halothermothrix orenii]|uniref:DAGKc domain-containing protein n=1 Tax=Halothermothrix orenii (strain H 168 / OCM 544 / DSM 9562) TaxID=373903 RepID=B8CYG9_HALOH|nr:diacylglycerol kinase family protein [Halothermothrix orenii]ACL70338.1 conserved protein of unknown function BmrU [Halothermothrix orenii H 168]
MEETILAIVNPVSAGGRTGKKWPKYFKKFQSCGLSIKPVYTCYPGHATTIVRQGFKEGYKKVMAVGGDGTINEVVNGFFKGKDLINPEARLIVFSRGTGSDFIKSLGITSKFKDIINIIKNGEVEFIDVGLVTYVTHKGNRDSRYFINLADVGIGSETVYEVNKGDKVLGGPITYLLGLFKVLARYKNKVIKLIVDEKEILNERINSIMVANGKYFGGGIKIAPTASLRDGLFDLVVLKDLNRKEILSNLVKAFKGLHLSHPKVDSLSCQKVIIDSGEQVLLEIDGESIGRLPATFEIIGRRLPVLLV